MTIEERVPKVSGGQKLEREIEEERENESERARTRER